MKTFITVCLMATALTTSGATLKAGDAVVEGYVRTATGLHLADGPGALRVEFVTPDIVRVRFTHEADFLGNNTGACIARSAEPVAFDIEEEAGTVVARSDSLRVSIDLASHAITFADARTGRVLLAEAVATPRECEQVIDERVVYDETTKRKVVTADGEKEVMDVLRRDTVGHTWRLRNYFRFQAGEALYGLGSHMEDYLDLRGHTMYLIHHNLKAVVPVINSTAGYGLLFDAGCSMVFSDEEQSYVEMEAANEIDYYLMKGATMDATVRQYRRLTGQVPMLPRYMLGYIQSKERYTSSSELVGTVQRYRELQVPLDLIVQDWNYWPQGWGYLKMDRRFYPDVRSLTDSIHGLGAHLMVSIWPNATNCPQHDDFERRGFLLPRSNYDVFNPLARRHYWRYVNDEFFGNGVDAWWCDCSEPLDGDWSPQREGYGWDNHRERWERNTRVLSEELGAGRALLYSLNHARGIYENQRSTSSEKRVANLTRSSFAGQQRYATITWNGDTHASWRAFACQIPAGLNFMATGCNYWTVDAGAFFTRPGWQWFQAAEFPDGVADPAYREFYVRMLQWATFLPLMRSHGTDTPREIWNFGEPGTPFYDAILRMIRLRYELLPYNYSLTDRVTREGYTMARLLAFDFGDDARVRDLKDEYMFGPALLVCPVTSAAISRSVYLPATKAEAGSTAAVWYDFWTDSTYAGGQTLQAAAPIDRLPLFVRAGSIVPMGPVVQYAAQQGSRPVTLHIYPGRDADFTLYADEGDSYRYEQGEAARVRLHWDDSRRRLDIGDREGSYRGMPTTQTFNIVVHAAPGARKAGNAERQITYDGRHKTLKL